MASQNQPSPIQFRPGPVLGVWLVEFAVAWELSENEAAKRLACLAACGLDTDNYPLLAKLAAALLPPHDDRPDFARACDHVHTTVATANRTRESLGSPPMTAPETLALVRRTVEDAVRVEQARRRRVQQRQTVKARRTQ
jgi:hypothetical protein